MILEWAKGQQKAFVAMTRAMVECESPSDDAASVNRFVELLSVLAAPFAKVKTVSGGKFGKHLLCEFPAGSRRAEGRVLALGHSDTVWPSGTLRSMPFRQAEGRLWGPGVLDMKAGLAVFLFAMRGLRDLDIPLAAKVLLQVNSDEEVGSDSSRALTEKNARASSAVLVLEPGTGLTGKLKTARKGVGDFRVTVRGRAAHAGVDFANGASAIVELARQVQKIAAFTDLPRGITVNPGVIGGGIRTNVIAAEARVDVDFRIARMADFARLERRFRGLRAVDRRCSLEVEGGLNRPPMERSDGVVQLFRRAQAVGRAMGVEVEESATGGGSDGNFTAALGVPTLDGLGAVGEGAHAVNESILLARVPDRIALLAGLLAPLDDHDPAEPV